MDRHDLPLIARRVSGRRAEMGLTAEQVVARMPERDRMSLSNYRSIERGERTVAQARTCRALAAALAVPEDTVRLWYAGRDEEVAASPPMAVGDDLTTLSARLARMEAMMQAGTDPKMRDLDALDAVLGCLSDEQFRLVALAVTSHDRFDSAAVT
jgi:transcriptional regulator with XRE-family HTH domain